jgi:signal transduction histidine kinase
MGTHIVVASGVCADELLLIVADDGPGIPSDAREQVFSRFQQLNPADSSGSGLGLAIARRLIELHRGRLWVESWSESGSGTVAEPAPVARIETTGTRVCVALPRGAA